MVSAFNDVVETATPALVLVAGYSGIGKSSVVNELHKVLVPPRGLFAAGKFDQYKGRHSVCDLRPGIPAAARRPLLGEAGEELMHWRDAVTQALGPNAALLLELVPELH